MLLLLSCWIIAGITAEDQPTLHYRVKNSSLCLQVGKSPPYQDVRWSFNDKFIVYNKNITPSYTDKVDYNPRNHSLCIKKLTEMDSGIYKVSITDLDFKESTELHRHIVEETVPRPVIRMLVIPSNRSAGFCNITVNCSIQDDWVWSVCDGDSCRTSQGSLRKVNITISADNRSIVCTGNNHVSTRNVSESIEATCFNKSNPGHEETPQLPIVIMIVIAMCVSFCAFIFYMAKGLSTKNNHHQAQTSSAQLTQSQPVEAQPQLVPRVSTSSSGQSEASYENVDATQPSQTSSPTISPREELGSKQSQKVDTVYSVLEVPNVNASLGKSDGSKATKGHKKLQEALTSQSVTVDEAEHPTQIDTVYSMLQKPKNLKSQHHQ